MILLTLKPHFSFREIATLKRQVLVRGHTPKESDEKLALLRDFHLSLESMETLDLARSSSVFSAPPWI